MLHAPCHPLLSTRWKPAQNHCDDEGPKPVCSPNLRASLKPHRFGAEEEGSWARGWPREWEPAPRQVAPPLPRHQRQRPSSQEKGQSPEPSRPIPRDAFAAGRDEEESSMFSRGPTQEEQSWPQDWPSPRESRVPNQPVPSRTFPAPKRDAALEQRRRVSRHPLRSDSLLGPKLLRKSNG